MMVSGGMILDLYMVARCPPSQCDCLGKKLHMALCKNRTHTIAFLVKNSANEKAKNVENDIFINFFTFKVDHYVFCYECLLDNSKLVMNIYLSSEIHLLQRGVYNSSNPKVANKQ